MVSPSSPSSSRLPRLLSVDALRGLDMFWIVGGEHVARALGGMSDNLLISAVVRQLTHVEWEGCHFFDVIFPLFLFLVGVSIVLSTGASSVEIRYRAALWRITKRACLLFAVGFVFYGGFSRTWPDLEFTGVLPRIAICYFVAATLHTLVPRPAVIGAAMLCLVGYWGMLKYVPFPDVDLKHAQLAKRASQATEKSPAVLLDGAIGTVRGTYQEGHNLANYVDYRWLPGRKRNLYYANEGLLSHIPSIATTLFGIMAGWLITSNRWGSREKVAWLIGIGAGGVVVGYLWSLDIPIIKRIWTPSFCLVAAGWSAIALGVFYWIVEIRQWKNWCRPFLWIGSNALVVYLANEFIDFHALASRLTGGDVQIFVDRQVGSGMGGLVLALVALTFPVLLARFLYQRKLFLRL